MSEKLVLPKSQAPQMFDAIASRYDFLNRLLSLGQDLPWRSFLREYMPQGGKLSVLDIATGTGDVLITLAKNNPCFECGVGIDLAVNMLKIGQQKIDALHLSSKLSLQVGDAEALPFLDGSFDCVTISFGIRNIPDLRLVLLEMYRVTKSGGCVVILEFSKPKNPFLRAGHWFYMNAVVPTVGFVFSGNFKAYQYLNQTIKSFPYGEQFCHILRQFGFVHVKAFPLMGGVATIYTADKAL